MLKNYLKIALRNMKRQRAYASINIIGLTIGIVCAILITTFVRYELSFDTSIPEAEHIYRVVQRQPGNVFLGSDQFVVTPAPLAHTIQAEVPGIAASTLFTGRSGLLTVSDDHFFEEGMLADGNFFDVFDYPLLSGSPEDALQDPESIVLTKSLAERIFGREDPIGQLITLNMGFGGVLVYSVSGIVADPPTNSHIQFSFVASILEYTNYRDNLDRWGNSSWYTYYRIQEGQDPGAVEAQIQALPAKYYPDDDPAERRHFLVQSALSVHLFSNINFDFAENGDINFIYLLSAIGLVVLLLACVNYVNLAIARSLQRAKEVGVRKVVGAVRRQLIWQFLSQSILTSAVAVIISLGLVALVLPKFASFVERDLSFFADGFVGLAVLMIVFVVLVGVMGGLYPALVASRMKPARILKGDTGSGKAGSGLRRTLVTVQFIVSVTLIASTLIIFNQMRFIDSKELGYRKDHVLAVSLQDPNLRDRFREIKTTIENNPDVMSVSSSSNFPTRISSSSTASRWTGSGEDKEVTIYQLSVGYDFLDIYEIPVVHGRGFSPEYPADDSLNALILNETAFATFGWNELDGKFVGERPVVGVVKDFHMHSLRLEVMPLMMRLSPDRGSRLSIKITGTEQQGTAQFVEQTLSEMSDYPVEVQFIDDVYSELYEDDQTLSKTVGLFTLLALIIGALGLFGLVAYSAETRSKEIGVRKVLGASVPSILRLFANEYAAMIIVAGVLGTPIAYFAMSRWLDQFVYRVELGPLDFVISIGILIAVAAVSMIFQTTKAATSNPVSALRYE